MVSEPFDPLTTASTVLASKARDAALKNAVPEAAAVVVVVVGLLPVGGSSSQEARRVASASAGSLEHRAPRLFVMNHLSDMGALHPR
jgi:hypothetical protein